MAFSSLILYSRKGFLLLWMFIVRVRRLSSNLLKHGYLIGRLKPLLMKFYCRYGNLRECSNIMSPPHEFSRMFYGIPPPRQVTTTFKPIRIFNKFLNLIPSLTSPYYEFPLSICKEYNCMQEGYAYMYQSGHQVPSLFVICLCSCYAD